MQINPLGDMVVVRPDAPKTMTAGGLHIPGQSQVRTNRGRVEAVGPGRTMSGGARSTMLVEPGQSVCYHKFAGSEVDLGEDGKVRLISVHEILGILPDLESVETIDL